MIRNLTTKQILIAVVVIIIVLWLLARIFGIGKRKPQMPIQQVAQPPMLQPVQRVTSPVGSEMPQQQTNPFVLYYFSAPGCGACTNFDPTWDQLVKRLGGVNGLSAQKIDVTKQENENLSFYYSITQTPTIILVTPDRNIEYNGDRNVDELYRFVLGNINQYSNNNQY